jgi:hypothetical protein
MDLAPLAAIVLCTCGPAVLHAQRPVSPVPLSAPFGGFFQPPQLYVVAELERLHAISQGNGVSYNTSADGGRTWLPVPRACPAGGQRGTLVARGDEWSPRAPFHRRSPDVAAAGCGVPDLDERRSAPAPRRRRRAARVLGRTAGRRR